MTTLENIVDQKQDTIACPQCESKHTLYLKIREVHLCGDCEHVFDDLHGQNQQTLDNLLETTTTKDSISTTNYDEDFLGDKQTHIFRFTLYQMNVPLNIFLSYGHDEYQECALRLKKQLSERGHTVWIDTEKLSPGCDWEQGITDALTWIKESQEHGKMLLLMTPHALRRPDGYCLNEIAKALTLKINIFPVMISTCDPPQSIESLPYFDFRDCLSNNNDSSSISNRNSHCCCNVSSSSNHSNNSFCTSCDCSEKKKGVQQSKEQQENWNAVFAERLDSIQFKKKAAHLIAALEMSRSISDYSVALIAGKESIAEPCISSPKHSSSERFFLSRGKSHASSISSMDYLVYDLDNTMLTAGETSPKSMLENEELDTRLLFCCDPSCLPLANRLYEDLTKEGFEIYPLGSGSEERVNEGIKWTSQVRCGKMVLFLTPESVGRPNGVCLNDITAAITAKLGVIPILIRSCEIPLSICRIQWLDMTDCMVQNLGLCGMISWGLNEVRYPQGKAQLLLALTEGLDHDGLQARLFSLLAPFSFQSEISNHASLFSGREWLMKKLTNWMESRHCGNLFWITGQIGSGKTAIASRAIQSMPQIVAFHLASRDDKQTQSARRCLLSLAYMLCLQLPEYRVNLQSGNEPLEEIVVFSTLQTLLDKLILDPLHAIAPPHQPLVILIDGLEMLVHEEEMETLDDSLLAILPYFIRRLPLWLRLLIFSREDAPVMQRLQGFTPNISLDRYVNENKADIVEYVTHALHHFSPTVAEDKISSIVKHAEGLFLYASHMIHALADGSWCLDHLQTAPVGFGGILHQFFDNQFSLVYYKTTVRPVLEVLAAAYEPLSPTILGSVMQWETYAQNTIVSSFGSLFYVTFDGALSAFHSSVFDWLKDPIHSGDYYVEVKQGHNRLGEWGYRQFKALQDETHALSSTTSTTSTTLAKLAFGENPEESGGLTNSQVYIIRHTLNHLKEANGEMYRQLHFSLNQDSDFFLERQLLSCRENGLQCFFHGNIDRVLAESLLSKSPAQGAFLIRFSTRKGCYCTSFISEIVHSRPIFKHNLIYHYPEGYSVVPPEQFSSGNCILYKDLTSFVEVYLRNGILRHAIPRSVRLS